MVEFPREDVLERFTDINPGARVSEADQNKAISLRLDGTVPGAVFAARETDDSRTIGAESDVTWGRVFELLQELGYLQQNPEGRGFVKIQQNPVDENGFRESLLRVAAIEAGNRQEVHIGNLDLNTEPDLAEFFLIKLKEQVMSSRANHNTEGLPNDENLAEIARQLASRMFITHQDSPLYVERRLNFHIMTDLVFILENELRKTIVADDYVLRVITEQYAATLLHGIYHKKQADSKKENPQP
jgi:hypothetical protein